MTPALVLGYLPRCSSAPDVIDDSIVFQDTANSRIGIGTATPAKTLEVAGQVRIASTSCELQFRETSQAYPNGLWRIVDGGSGAAAADMVFQENTATGGDFSTANQVLWLKTGGKVGIMTTSPSGKLDVAGAFYTADGKIIIRQQDAGGTEGGEIELQGSAGDPSFIIDNYDGRLRFVRTSPAGLDVVNILQNGNVGIGITSPAVKMHVKEGNARVEKTTGDTELDMVAPANNHARLNLGEAGGTAGQIDYSNTNDYMAFDTAGAERMRIESDGDVGIGRTDPRAKLHVKGGGVSIEDVRGAGRLGFVHNGEDDPRIVFHRGGTASPSPDITILRNFPPSTPPQGEATIKWTLLRVWAPRIPSPAPDPLPDREATIALVRDLSPTDDRIQEFVDFYNNGYLSTGSVQHGIRIQKRNPTDPQPGEPTAVYRDFVFDQDDGTTKTPIMILKADTKVGIGTTTPQTLLDVAGQARVKPVTFSSLPAASSSIQGAIAAVTDSTTSSWGTTITGGGANKVLAYCNGTNWTVAGK